MYVTKKNYIFWINTIHLYALLTAVCYDVWGSMVLLTGYNIFVIVALISAIAYIRLLSWVGTDDQFATTQVEHGILQKNIKTTYAFTSKKVSKLREHMGYINFLACAIALWCHQWYWTTILLFSSSIVYRIVAINFNKMCERSNIE
jgi:hypothetical protein